ncbi:MAG: homoserine O-acetyltransferase MetX [Rhizomicrobium sp.]
MAETGNPRFLRPVTAADADVGQAITFGPDNPLTLDCGKTLSPLTVAYMTYGTLNAAHSNAVLICHALTLDQFVASANPVTGKPGWWEMMVGPGKPIDTDRFFVICANVVGGCMGTTGPAETCPATGKPYGLDFPLVTVRDMVRAQAMLLDALGIEKVMSVIGGSMGGMQVLQWTADFPDRVVSAVPIACAARHSAQNIALHEVGRQAIMADPDWKGGTYQLHGTQPSKGLAVARMAAHITYLSETALQRKFGRDLQNREQISFGFGPDFQIESYLRHQGMTFVDRFDANSYLYITRAMDYFDLAAEHEGKLAEAFRGSKTRFCLIAFTSDWLFPTAENKRVAHALNATAATVSFVEIQTDRGHDAFLLDEPEMFATVRGFLNSVAAKVGA